jgi:AraC-like DNA-binding protein
MATRPSALTALRQWVLAAARSDGITEGPYPGLILYRFSRRTAVRKQPVVGVTLCVGLQGDKLMRVGPLAMKVDRRDFFVITRDTVYDSTVTPESDERPFLSFSLTFSPDLVAKVLGALADEGAARTAEVAPAFAARLTADLGDALVRFVGALNDPAERRSLAPLVVEEIVFRLLRSDAAAAMRSALRPQDAARISDAMRQLRANPTARISVRDMARRVAMSPSHFAHRFRAIARMSPMRFVKEVRLEHARTLLLGERARANDVATRVGYESASHFTRDFKRRYGVSPARYASQVGGSPQTPP